MSKALEDLYRLQEMSSWEGPPDLITVTAFGALIELLSNGTEEQKTKYRDMLNAIALLDPNWTFEDFVKYMTK